MAAQQFSSSDDKKKVWELIKDIKVALMVTRGEGGRLHSRPMAAAQNAFDGELWFMSKGSTPKLSELAQDEHVLLAYSEPKNQNYVSVSGTASTTRDRAKIKELWSEPMRVWFPKGPEDDDIALIKVSVESAEYWDAPTAAWVYAYGYVKARITGEPPKSGENKVVTF